MHNRLQDRPRGSLSEPSRNDERNKWRLMSDVGGRFMRHPLRLARRGPGARRSTSGSRGRSLWACDENLVFRHPGSDTDPVQRISRVIDIARW